MALEKALRILAVRAHSEWEIVDKLTRAGFDAQAVASAMALLTEYGLVDDDAFARAWVASRARKGLGPYRIAHELRQKGIAAALCDAALADIECDDSLQAATVLAQKHLRRGDANAKRRAYDAVCRRGFSYETARQAIANAQQLLESAETGDDME